MTDMDDLKDFKKLAKAPEMTGAVTGDALGLLDYKLAKELAQQLELTNVHRIPWDRNLVVINLCKERKRITTLSDHQRILEDNEDTSTMVFSAKTGRWEKVFPIVERKPYIINGIPQERAWSALHQAAWHDNSSAVEKLLSFDNCDPGIRAKRDWNNYGEAGMTPHELAVKHQRKCKDLLKLHSEKDAKELEETFISAEKGQVFLKDSIPYFDLACSFLKREVVQRLALENNGFQCITEKMYSLLEQDWEYVQSTLRECLYPFDKMVADKLKGATSCEELKKAMIWIYTCNRVYRNVNAALRRASKTEFPVSDDLLLSLYSVFLASILLHWKDLTPIQKTTYRGLGMAADQAKLYSKDTTFYWLPFTSSTRVRSQAERFSVKEKGVVKALFIIDNSLSSLWSPRDIVPFSINGPHFLEVVHPPCAKFCVTRIQEQPNYTEYHIQLLCPDS